MKTRFVIFLIWCLVIINIVSVFGTIANQVIIKICELGLKEKIPDVFIFLTMGVKIDSDISLINSVSICWLSLLYILKIEWARKALIVLFFLEIFLAFLDFFIFSFDPLRTELSELQKSKFVYGECILVLSRLFLIFSLTRKSAKQWFAN